MIYLADVEKDIEKTWSGTTFSLYESLSKKNDMTPIFHIYEKGKLKKLKYVVPNLVINKKIEKDLNFNMYYQKKREKLYLKDLSKHNNIQAEEIIQVGDIAEIEGSSIYTDLSVGFLIDCYENDLPAFQRSGFQHISKEALIERNKIQIRRYEKAKYIFTMSNSLREYLLKKGYSEDKVVYVGGGRNILQKTKNYSEKEKSRNKILFVGRDFYRKGGDLLVQAFRIAKQKQSNLELYIAGPRELANELLDNGIIFLGDLSPEELIKYFDICDIFCMPSKFEAYGLVFAEALTQGLPCIGLDKYEMRYFINKDKNGYLLGENEDETILADLILRLMQNDEIFCNVKREKSSYVRDYSWDMVSKRIMDCLSNE